MARGSAPPNDEARGGGAIVSGRVTRDPPLLWVDVAPPTTVWVGICNFAVRVPVAAPVRDDTFIQHFLLKTYFRVYA
jgi:hypothetical protein